VQVMEAAAVVMAALADMEVCRALVIFHYKLWNYSFQ